MKRKLALIANGLVLGICLASTGCNGFGGDTPQGAWERYMDSFAARDYGALWDSMSKDSREDTVRVLTHVKRDPQYGITVQRKFNISPQTLSNMQPRDFFIALMNGADRALPQVVKIRAERFKSAHFVREEIHDDRAMVFWESTGGALESMMFVLEDSRWKPVIKR